MTDEEIVEKFLARDEDALRQTSEKYGGRLHSLAYGILEDMPEAEECVNDTYLAAWNSIPPHAPRDYLFAYLARITRHLSLDRCRMRTREKRSARVEALTAELIDCIPAPERTEERLEAGALGETISVWLRTLPAEKRILFLRRYWYGDGVSDLAKGMGWGESRVKTTLHRLRKELRAHLEKEGYL
jgi:RNA polymerase sigma-70 factor (ECF subfamily)